MIRNTKEVVLYQGTKHERIIGFRSGTHALGVSCHGSGIKDPQDFLNEVISGNSLFAIQWFLYGCAVQYCEWKSLKVDFTCGIVSEWTEDIGLEKSQDILQEMLRAYFPKNQNPPEKPGEEISQQSTTGNSLPSLKEGLQVSSSGS